MCGMMVQQQADDPVGLDHSDQPDELTAAVAIPHRSEDMPGVQVKPR
jgi:hypothetical protein